MSETGDTDLRDLVCQILAGKGVLGKIKAEVRANVFHVLNEQKPISRNDSYFEEFSKTEKGEIILSLVRELLNIFNLKYTLSVFDAETNEGHYYTHHERNVLLQEVGLTDTVENGVKQPVLAQILNNFMWSDEKLDSLVLKIPNDGDEKSAKNIKKHTDVIQNGAGDSTLNPLNTGSEYKQSEPEDMSKNSYMEEWLENLSSGETDNNSVPVPITAVTHDSEENIQNLKKANSETPLVSAISMNPQEVHVDPTFTTNQSLSSLRNLPPIVQQHTRRKVTDDIMDIVKLGLEKSDSEDNVLSSLSDNESEALSRDPTSDKIVKTSSKHDKAIPTKIKTVNQNKNNKAGDKVRGDTVRFSNVVSAGDRDDLYDNNILDMSDKNEDDVSRNSDVLSDKRDNLSVHSNLSDKSNSKYSQQNSHDTCFKVAEECNTQDSGGVSPEHVDNTVSKSKTCDKDSESLLNTVSSQSEKSNRCDEKTVSRDSEHPQCETEKREKEISQGSISNQKGQSSKTEEEESDIEEAISFELDISNISEKDLSTHDTTISNVNEIEADYMEDL